MQIVNSGIQFFMCHSTCQPTKISWEKSPKNPYKNPYRSLDLRFTFRFNIWVFPKIRVPPKHPKVIMFSGKTHGCWVPPFLETSIWLFSLATADPTPLCIDFQPTPGQGPGDDCRWPGGERCGCDPEPETQNGKDMGVS